MGAITLARMNKLIKDGNGIAYGVPATLDKEGRIIDEFGRRLETVNEYNTRIEERNMWCNKLYGRKATHDIEDPITGDIMIQAGNVFDETAINQAIEAGLCIDKLFERHSE